MSVARKLTTLIDWFYIKPIRVIAPLQTFRYGVCGGVNLVFSWLLYAFFYNIVLDKQIVYLPFVAISPYIASFLITFPITFFSGFWLQKNIAFVSSPLRGGTQMFRYLISVIGSIVLNYLCLKLLVEVVGLYPTPSQMVASLLTVAYSYLMQRHFTFRGCE